MNNFNVKVNFTPAYHSAGNGAIERQHLTLKNSIKAALVDMGNTHRDKWMRALPWTLLGKRCAYLPSLDASAAQMVLGMEPKLPGQLLGHPGPPLNTSQLRGLLQQLYQLSDRPGLQNPKAEHKVMPGVDQASHVYIKSADPQSLCPAFEGPYPVVDRPSYSTVTVRLSYKKDGSPHLQTYNWNRCKIAHLREGAEAAARPRPGRPSKAGVPHPSPSSSHASSPAESSESTEPPVTSPPPEVPVIPLLSPGVCGTPSTI